MVLDISSETSVSSDPPCIDPFVPNPPFLFLLKTSENLTGF